MNSNSIEEELTCTKWSVHSTKCFECHVHQVLYLCSEELGELPELSWAWTRFELEPYMLKAYSRKNTMMIAQMTIHCGQRSHELLSIVLDHAGLLGFWSPFFYSWTSHVRPPCPTLLAHTNPPTLRTPPSWRILSPDPQPIRFTLTPPHTIKESTDIHGFSHHVILHIWILRVVAEDEGGLILHDFPFLEILILKT